MPGPEVLSIDDFEKRYGSGAATASSGGGGATYLGSITPSDSPERLSLDEFNSRYGSQNQGGALGSYLWDSAKQFGSGAVQGVSNLLTFLPDMGSDVLQLQGHDWFHNPFSLTPPKITAPWEQQKAPVTKLATDALNATVLSQPDPEHRYARKIGEFVGPQAALGPVGLMGGTTGLLSAGAAGVGSQAAEDFFPNNPVASFLGALVGSGTPVVAGSGLRGLKTALLGASEAELKGAAGQVVRDYTGLTGEAIAAADAAAPKDALGRMMSTAEVTNNAGMAQMEKQLAQVGQRADRYKAIAEAREAERNSILRGMTKATPLNDEARGAAVINKADEVAARMAEQNIDRWGAFDRTVPLPVDDAQVTLAPLFPDPAAGRGLNSEVEKLATQVMEAHQGQLTSGQWQIIRSESLELLRDKTLHNADRKMLSAIAQEADSAAKNGLSPNQYALWRSARQGTARTAERFKPKTAGGILTDSRTRPINALDSALKGDRLSAVQIRDAVANDPVTMEQIKAGLLKRIGRDAQGRLTPKKMSDFLVENEGAVSYLFEDTHKRNLSRITEDLLSQAKVQENATYASKNQSPTSQNRTVAGAFSDIMATATLRQASPWAQRLWTLLREGVGLKDQARIQDWLIEAAMKPQVAAELAATPNTQRVLNLGERLTNTLEKALQAGGRAGATWMAAPNQTDNRATPGQPQLATKLLESQPARNTAMLSQPNEREEPRRTGQSPNRKILEQDRSQQGQLGQESTASLFPSSYNYRPGGSENQGLYAPLSESEMALKQATPANLPYIMEAIRQTESSGGKKTTSKDNGNGLGTAKGDYQLLDSTGKDWHKRLGITDPYDPYDDEQARTIATAYLSHLLDLFDGDVEKAITAYHSGEGNVQKGKIGPAGRNYFPTVEKHYDRLVSASDALKA